MRFLSLIIFTVISLFFVGCSGKKYFEPEKTFSASNDSSNPYGGHIINLSRTGGTLKDGTYIGKSGISQINMGEGYRFINENKLYLLASNSYGILKVINKKTGKSSIEIPLKVPVVSASLQNGKIAYILNNNTFGLYKIKGKQKIFESRSDAVNAIDIRTANPLFIGNLVIMPMLDGKLIILDTKKTENSKVIYISNQKSFNNVIYLARMNNILVASTSKRVISLGANGKKEYKANISEVVADSNRVYIFTKEGEILILNSSLELIKSKKYKFAHYSVATVFDGKIYALDQQGSLIVTNKELTRDKIYELGEIEEPAFITGKNLYKDGQIIDLDQLDYK